MLTVGSDKVQVRLNRGDLAPHGIPYFLRDLLERLTLRAVCHESRCCLNA